MSVSIRVPLTDSDLQMGVGGQGAGGHPDPEIRGAARQKKKTKSFRPFGPHFGLEITGGGGVQAPPGPSAGSATGFIDVYHATWPSGQSALDL